VLGSAHGVVVDFAELSDAGRDPDKQINEDAAGYAETPFGHLAVVCDGMGGHSAGREASQAAVRSVIERARSGQPGAHPGHVLREAIERAGRAVYAVGGNSLPELRPGSTCVAVLIHANGCEIAHAGDSRAYLIRHGRIDRLTRDHSMVQEMVDSGLLTPEQAREHPEANKITRALGIAPETTVDLRSDPLLLAPADTLILCTDGLTDLVSDPEILDVVQRRIGHGTAVVCQELVALANSRGGYDNVTVLLLHVVEVPHVPITTGATIIDAGRTASGTLVPAEQRNRTVSDDGRPAPTLFDDGSTTHRAPGPTQPGVITIEGGDRTTQPGPSLQPSVPSFPDNEPPVLTGRPMSSTRAVWMLLGLLVVGALFAALAWGAVKLLQRRHDPGDEIVPPPSAVPYPSATVEPSASAPVPSASVAPAASVPKPDAPSDAAPAQ